MKGKVDFTKPDIKDLLIRRTNKKIIFTSLIIVILSLATIIATFICELDEKWTNLLITIVSSIFSIAAVAFLWELFVKRSYTDELYAKMDIRSNILATGIVKVETRFEKVGLENYLKDIDEATIVILWGASMFESQFEKQAFNNIRNLNIVIVDKDNTEIINTLEKRYSFFDKESNYNAETIIKRIKQAEKYIDKIKENITVNLYTIDVPLLASYYILGEYAIMTTFNHTKKMKDIATFICQKGSTGHDSMYQYIITEVNSILDYAKNYSKTRRINEK